MIKFMKYKWLYFLISGMVLVPGIFSLFIWGLRPSIDFTGGTLIEIKNETLQQRSGQEFKNVLEKNGFSVGSVQSSGTNNFLIRLKPITMEENKRLLSTVEKEFEKTEEIRFIKESLSK